MNIELIVAGAAIAVSVLSALYSYKQARYSAWQATLDYLESIRGWAFEVLRVVVDATHGLNYATTQPELDALKRTSLADLSTAVENGRLFLPNVDKGDGYGSEKPKAYQGYKPLALEYLVTIYTTLEATTLATAQQDKLTIIRIQKEFLSEIQDILNVRDFIKKFENDLNYTISSENTLQSLQEPSE